MKILFLGEKAEGSAEYVRDCLLELGHDVVHFGFDQKIPDFKDNYNAIIVSDYPSKEISSGQSKAIIKMVENGSRFIMIGGWGSFNGKGNSYYGHPLADCLPVILSPKDDRNNVPQGLVIFPDPDLHTDMPINWLEPPIVCGYNAAMPKDTAQVLVWMKPVQTDGSKIMLKKPVPLVIKNFFGKGVSIACLTDLAPHWCGGLVDWGSRRLGLAHVEIGDMFILFVQLLLEI
ncbi:MAG: glutamine amidotransferase [bacterium]|nr:glutamine amidotransferase [bacterium]